MHGYPRARVEIIIIISGRSQQLRYPAPPLEREGPMIMETRGWLASDLIWRFGAREMYNGQTRRGQKKVLRDDWVEMSCRSGWLLPPGPYEVRLVISRDYRLIQDVSREKPISGLSQQISL